MKKNFGIILAVALGLSALLLTIAFQAGWVQAKLPGQETRTGAPSMVSYQGQIWDGDTPFEGKGSFMFAIINSANETTWSNDGDPTPTTPVYLKVTNGLFNVNLGEIDTENGMLMELDPRAFNDPTSYLRVWFSPDGGDFTQMPDQPIASVPYALRAEEAAFAGHASSASSAANSDTLDSQHATAFQLRVTGNCPVGQYVQAVNSNGSVVCAQPPTFTISSLEHVGAISINWSPDVAIGTDGLGLLSYTSTPDLVLKVAHCSNLNCSMASITTFDGMGVQGPSLVIGNDGLGLISFHQAGDLKVLHCSDTNCTNGTISTLDSEISFKTQWDTSIAIGSDGMGLISYFVRDTGDITNGNLKVAHCINANCTSATTTTVWDYLSDQGQNNAIAIGSDGLGLIAYYDKTNLDLKVAHCNDLDCSNPTQTTVYSTGWTGMKPSVAIGPDGLGLISFFDAENSALKVAHCANYACTTSSIATVEDSPGYVGNFSSIAIGSDGLALISYYGDKSLKLAHCSNIYCSSSMLYTLDNKGDVGWYTSIAVGSDNRGLISYFDYTNQNLNVAHCSNELCLPINFEDLP
jgi:hypothetical protein